MSPGRHGNLIRPKGIGITELLAQPAFHAGVADYRSGLPLREADQIPALQCIRDTAGNRARIYEAGRLVAAFARCKRRAVNAATARAAKASGYLI